jgi:hypothetical protein
MVFIIPFLRISARIASDKSRSFFVLSGPDTRAHNGLLVADSDTRAHDGLSATDSDTRAHDGLSAADLDTGAHGVHTSLCLAQA